MSIAMERQGAGFRLKGWHVLAMMLAFFGITIAVNGVFVWMALDSWTGLTSEHSYQEGLAYNRQIARVEALKADGWRFDLVQEGRRIALVAARREGAVDHLVDGLAPMLELRRPTNDKEDRQLALTPEGDGRYGVDLGALGQGAWLARVVVPIEGESLRVLETRLWIK